MKMPTPYNQDPLAGPCAEHRRFLSDRSRSWLDPIIRRRSSLFGHVARLLDDAHQDLRYRRSVTQSPSRPELEAMSRPPSEQVAWPTPQGQQYTSFWPLETSRHVWTTES